jgi:hypothetical protein
MIFIVTIVSNLNILCNNVNRTVFFKNYDINGSFHPSIWKCCDTTSEEVFEKADLFYMAVQWRRNFLSHGVAFRTMPRTHTRTHTHTHTHCILLYAIHPQIPLKNEQKITSSSASSFLHMKGNHCLSCQHQ